MTRPGFLPGGRHPGPAPAETRPAVPTDLGAWLILVPLVVIFFSTLNAQLPRPSFDYVSRLPVPADASLMSRGDFNGDGLPDLLAAGSRNFSIYLQGKTSFEWSGNSGSLARPALLMATGRINGDSRDDLVTYSGGPPTVSIYLSGKNGVPVFKTSFEVEGDYRKMVVVDLDGDGASDILLFGKKTLGLSIFRGDGGGKFQAGASLYPDISISLVAVARMDEDEIPDLVAVNWISNQVLVSSGFGKMNFSDPAVIQADREPVAVAVGDMNADGYKDIVEGFAERPGFSVLAGDGSGRFRDLARGDLPSAPARIRIGDVDGDALNDLLVFTPGHGSVSVRYSNRTAPLSAEQLFSAGPDPADVLFFIDARKRLLNAAVLPAGGNFIRIVHNRTERFPGPAGWEFVTGADPGPIRFADLNSDNWPDVILAQGADRALSVFLNNGRGNLLGKVSVAIPEPVSSLLPVGGGGRDPGFLATGIDNRSVTYMTISGKDLSGERRMITLTEEVVPVDAGRRDNPGVTRIYAAHPGTREGSYGLSAFDVSGNNRYEEIDIPVAFAGIPLGMLSHDFNGDGLRDLVVITPRDSSGEAGVRLFLQERDGFVPDREARFNLGGVADIALTLWAGDFNGDGHDDLLFSAGKPVDRLFLSLAAGDTGFGPALPVLDGVRVPGTQGLSVVDFDADGITDLVFVNERSRTIQFLPGDGGGRFSGPVNLMSARNASGIGVADLNRDSEQELLVSGGVEGTLSITSFHHPLFQRRKQ